MAKKNQYWGVYETGVTATPKGPKKLIEEMAGMLSDATRGIGRKICIQKAELGRYGETTGVCYTNGIREKVRKARKPSVRKPHPPAPVSAPLPAPTLAAPELPTSPKPDSE